jgi:hypothetical protein
VTAKAHGKLAAIAPFGFEAVRRIDVIFDVERAMRRETSSVSERESS